MPSAKVNMSIVLFILPTWVFAILLVTIACGRRRVKRSKLRIGIAVLSSAVTSIAVDGLIVGFDWYRSWKVGAKGFEMPTIAEGVIMFELGVIVSLPAAAAALAFHQWKGRGEEGEKGSGGE